MKWVHGKNSVGQVDKLDDGKPVYVRSECGRFTVSRAVMARGIVHDAWLTSTERKARDSKGNGGMPTALASGVTAEQAFKAIEEYRGLHP